MHVFSGARVRAGAYVAIVADMHIRLSQGNIGALFRRSDPSMITTEVNRRCDLEGVVLSCMLPCVCVHLLLLVCMHACVLKGAKG